MGLPCALFALALGVRALPFDIVYQETGLQFFGHDAYYHLRRIAFSLAHFPSALGFDPYINFPEGARAIWPPLLDWTVAACLLPFHAFASWDRLESVIAWIPPVLGALNVVLLYELARRAFGSRVAALAGLYLALLSGHFWYSQLGFVDHHAAVAPLGTLVLASGMAFFGQSASYWSEPRRRAAIGISMGLAMGTSLALWPGTLLHVGLLEIALLVRLLGEDERMEAIRVAGVMVFAHAAAFCVIAPFGLGQRWEQWSAFSPVVLSSFQPWYFGAAAAFSLACAVVWSGERAAGASPSRRRMSALGIAVVLVGASLALWPSLGLGLDDVWQWFAREERFQRLVNESSPLFVHDGRFTMGIASLRLSGFVFLAPIAIGFFTWKTLRSPRRSGWGATLFLLWWTAALLAATLAQKRFFNSSSVPLALVFAMATQWAWVAVPRFPILARGGPVPGRVLVVLLVVGLMWPTLAAYPSHVENLLASRRGAGLQRVPPDTLRKAEALRLARWIRRATPETRGWIDVDERPEYGILAPWEIGHVLEYEGRRPTVTDNFGDDVGRRNFELAQSYYLGGETEALRILEGLDVRYVVVPSNAGFLSEQPGAGSMFASLHQFDGSAFRVAGEGGRVWIPAIERHRLIYEWIARPTNPEAQYRFKVFEVVDGARIVGRADPGAEVDASVRVETRQGRRGVYHARTIASEEGVYSLRVPYANSGAAANPGRTVEVRTSGRYELRCGEERASVFVGELAVVRGEVVTAPDLCWKRRPESLSN